MTKNQGTNKQRTAEYFKKFDRSKVLKKLINSSAPQIFDVGSNNGSSLVEFKSWWQNCEIHCFEPQHECWSELDELSDKYKNIFINKFAVGDAKANKSFFTHQINTGISGFSKININSKDSIDIDNLKNDKKRMKLHQNSINHQRKVPVIRLDDYIEEIDFQNRINLLKIDTQGYELEVIKGLGSKISKIDVIITELMFYDYYEKSLSFYDLESLLQPYGFSLYDISHIAKNPMNGRTDWVDVIYINKNIL